MTGRSLLLAAASLSLVIGACASRTPAGEAARSTARTTVEIRNHGFADQVIYVSVATGVRQRIGTAHGLTTTRLVIPRALVNPGTRLRLIADPVGGGRATIGDEILVDPGDELVMVILGN